MTSALLFLTVGVALAAVLAKASQPPSQPQHKYGCSEQYTWSYPLQRCLHFSTSAMAKKAAITHCGGREFVHINSQTENDEVHRLLHHHKKDNVGLWLGLRRYSHGWNWEDKNYTRPEYVNWYKGFPTIQADRTDSYMGGGGQWFDDRPSTSIQRVFICQEDPKLFCPLGWTLIEGSCFKFFSANKDFLLANGSCHSEGGYLAEPISATMNKGIYDLIKKGTSQPNAYIGITRTRQEATFKLAKTGTPVPYENWKAIHPTHDTSIDRCVLYSGNEAKWADVSCTDAAQYVCQRDRIVCRDGWTSIGHSCFKIHRDRKPFADAKAVCQKDIGGDIAEPTSDDMNRKIFSFLSLESPTRKRAYIGLRKLASSPHFTRQTTNRSPSFTHWISTENPEDDMDYCAGYHPYGKWDYIGCSRPEIFICQYGSIVCPTRPGLYGDRDIPAATGGSVRTLKCNNDYVVDGDSQYVCGPIQAANNLNGQWIGNGKCRYVIPTFCKTYGFLYRLPSTAGGRASYTDATKECASQNMHLPRNPLAAFGLKDPESRMRCLSIALEHYRVESTMLSVIHVTLQVHAFFRKSPRTETYQDQSGPNQYLCEAGGSYTCQSYGFVIQQPLWAGRQATFAAAKAECTKQGMVLPRPNISPPDGLSTCLQGALRYFGLGYSMVDELHSVNNKVLGLMANGKTGYYDQKGNNHYVCLNRTSYYRSSLDGLKAVHRCPDGYEIYHTKGYWRYSEAVTRCEATGGSLIHPSRKTCVDVAQYGGFWRRAVGTGSATSDLNGGVQSTIAELQVLCERQQEPISYPCSGDMKLVQLPGTKIANFATAQTYCRDYANGRLPSLDDKECIWKALKYFHLPHSLTDSHSGSSVTAVAYSESNDQYTTGTRAQSDDGNFLCKTGIAANISTHTAVGTPIQTCNDTAMELYIPYSTMPPRLYNQAVADCHATGGNVVHSSRRNCIQASSRLHGSSYWLLADNNGDMIGDSAGQRRSRSDHLPVVCERLRGSYNCPPLPSGYKLVLVQFPSGSNLREKYFTRQGLCASRGLQLPTHLLDFPYTPCRHPAIRIRDDRHGLSFRDDLYRTYDGPLWQQNRDKIICQNYTDYKSFVGDMVIIKTYTSGGTTYDLFLPPLHFPTLHNVAGLRCQQYGGHLPSSSNGAVTSVLNTPAYPFPSTFLQSTTKAGMHHYMCVRNDRSPKQYVCRSGKVKFTKGPGTGTKHSLAATHCRTHESGILPDMDVVSDCAMKAVRFFNMDKTWSRFYTKNGDVARAYYISGTEWKYNLLGADISHPYLCQSGVTKEDRAYLKGIVRCGGDEIYIPYSTGQMTYDEAVQRCAATGGQLPHWSRTGCLLNAIQQNGLSNRLFWATPQSNDGDSARGSDWGTHAKTDHLHVLCERVAPQSEYFCKDLKRKFVRLERFGKGTFDQAKERCQIYAHGQLPAFSTDMTTVSCLKDAMAYFWTNKEVIFSRTTFDLDHVRAFEFTQGNAKPTHDKRVAKKYPIWFLCEAELSPEDVIQSTTEYSKKEAQPSSNPEWGMNFFQNSTGTCSSTGGRSTGKQCIRRDSNCDLLFGGNCHKFFTKRTQPQAVQICGAWGGVLVEIKDITTSKLLYAKGNQEHNADFYWMSWVHKDFDQWARQPQPSQKCVLIGSDGKMYGHGCNHLFPFWCSRDAYAVPTYNFRSDDQDEYGK